MDEEQEEEYNPLGTISSCSSNEPQLHFMQAFRRKNNSFYLKSNDYNSNPEKIFKKPPESGLGNFANHLNPEQPRFNNINPINRFSHISEKKAKVQNFQSENYSNQEQSSGRSQICSSVDPKEIEMMEQVQSQMATVNNESTMGFTQMYSPNQSLNQSMRTTNPSDVGSDPPTPFIPQFYPQFGSMPLDASFQPPAQFPMGFIPQQNQMNPMVPMSRPVSDPQQPYQPQYFIPHQAHHFPYYQQAYPQPCPSPMKFGMGQQQHHAPCQQTDTSRQF